MELELLERGAPVISDGSRRLMTAEASEDLAHRRAVALQGAARPAAVEIRPLSRWRRWLLRRRLADEDVTAEPRS